MGAGHDHGGGVESITVGNIKENMKPRPKRNLVTQASLILRGLAFVGCIAHGMVSLLGAFEVAGYVSGQEFLLGSAPLSITVIGVVVAFVCGGESLFLETPNSQKVFKSLAEIIDNWLNAEEKTIPWYFWLLYTPAYFIGGGLIVELVQRYSPGTKADTKKLRLENAARYQAEKTTFITNAKADHFFTFFPHWTSQDVDILFLLTLIPRVVFRPITWLAWHGVLKHTINTWYPLIGTYGKESLPLWYLVIQPVVEPIALFFGALAGASEFWMGISAFMVFLAQSGVPMLIDTATGGLLSAGMAVLVVLFSVAYSNNLFLNGRRAVSSMRDMARGEISLRKQRNDDAHILRKPHVHDEAITTEAHENDASQENGHGHAHARTHKKYNEALGFQIYHRKGAISTRNADETIIASVKRGDARVDSPIFLIEGKPLLNKDGTLFSITKGDIVHLRLDEDGEQILCDHEGRPFLKDGAPLLFHEVHTATYRDGTPLIDDKGYPVLDAEGDLIFIRNTGKTSISKSGEEQIRWQACEARDNLDNLTDTEKATFTELKKGYWEGALTRNAGVFALIIGIVVAVGVGLLGVNTLFAALGVPSTPALVLSILAAAGYGLQNASLQGTEAFTLLKYIGQGLDDFNQSILKEGMEALGIDPAPLKPSQDNMLVNAFKAIGIRILGFMLITGEHAWNGLIAAVKFLWPDFATKAYYAAKGNSPPKWQEMSWRYAFAKPFFSFAKLLVGTVGPLAHGGEAFRAVAVGFPLIILLAASGAAVFTPPGWVMTLIVVFAIAGAAVMALQNRSLEVKNAHEALDAGLEAITKGRFVSGIVAPEVIRGWNKAIDWMMHIPQHLDEGKEWVKRKLWPDSYGKVEDEVIEQPVVHEKMGLLHSKNDEGSVSFAPTKEAFKEVFNAALQAQEAQLNAAQEHGTKARDQLEKVPGTRVYLPANTRYVERDWRNTQKEFKDEETPFHYSRPAPGA